MSQACTRSGESIVKLIGNVAKKIGFVSIRYYPDSVEFITSTTICTGPVSVQHGTNYIMISAQCTSNQPEVLNRVYILDENDNFVLETSIPDTTVDKDWTLRATVMLRWV